MQSNVVVGRINGVFGTRGWVKIYSYTRPRDNIFQYSSWQVGASLTRYRVLENKQQGSGLIARLDGVSDRDLASTLVGDDIAVNRSSLPVLAPGEYYWADLIGMSVKNIRGVDLGTVTQLLETGANDVLCVQNSRQRLIPFVSPYIVTQVDSAAQLITVDWHEDD